MFRVQTFNSLVSGLRSAISFVSIRGHSRAPELFPLRSSERGTLLHHSCPRPKQRRIIPGSPYGKGVP